jgi:hypothetical protein
VFDGGRVLFVLRPKEEKQPRASVLQRLQRCFPSVIGRGAKPTTPAGVGKPTRYELVGQCYIHGILDGIQDSVLDEGWKNMGSARSQVLELC